MAEGHPRQAILFPQLVSGPGCPSSREHTTTGWLWALGHVVGLSRRIHQALLQGQTVATMLVLFPCHQVTGPWSKAQGGWDPMSPDEELRKG